MKSLIVEDDPAIRKMIKSFLSLYGDCETVVDGKQALQTFEMELDEGIPYDLICMDIMMPRMDGLEAVKKIRDFEKEMGIDEEGKVKIIMLTALDKPEIMFDAYYDAGANSYITKPFDPDIIINELSNLGLI